LKIDQNKVENQVTVLINGVSNLKIKQLEKLLETFDNNLTVTVYIAIPPLENVTNLKNSTNVKFYEFTYDTKPNAAKIWQFLAKKAKTRYIFVGRSLQNLSTNLTQILIKLLGLIR